VNKCKSIAIRTVQQYGTKLEELHAGKNESEKGKFQV